MRLAVEQLGLPLGRFRKLNGILNALIMQIEDGGDSPEVNKLLLDALRAAIRHQVGDEQGAAALRAIDVFEQAEAERWELVRAGRTPPRELAPAERIEELLQEGYHLLQARKTTAACDRWLEAWEVVKGLARPEFRTADAFDQAYGLVHDRTSDWVVELSLELWNAGLDDPTYHGHRVRIAREFLALFPDSEPDIILNLRRGEGESLWALGRREAAEAVYAALVERLPDEGLAYIAWSDQYYLFNPPDRPKEYRRAEAILRRALRRPDLRDRGDVLHRLARLYREWHRPEEQAAVGTFTRGEGKAQSRLQRVVARLKGPGDAEPASPSVKPQRNDPCWCGSGKKYKHCHMQSDRKDESW
jgi:tetratricopeptide (TPR) repeat protein